MRSIPFLMLTLLVLSTGSTSEEAVRGELRFSLSNRGSVVSDAASTGGVGWADYDGDGDLDLLATNGYDVSSAEPAPQPNRLYRNDGNGGFEIADAGPVTADEDAAAVASGDFDDDGDVDVCIGNCQAVRGPGESNRLLVNEGSSGNWLKVGLVGTDSNRGGIGARIFVVTEIDGELRRQTREVASQTGFRSQSCLVQHFGLETASTVSEVSVIWPSGRRSRETNVPGNRRITITEE